MQRKIYFRTNISDRKKDHERTGTQHIWRNLSKKWHCLRGLDGKYGLWDEILRDNPDEKLKIVQNKKRGDSDTDDHDEDDEDDEEMPEETGTPKVDDTSKKVGRYALIRTNPEEDALVTRGWRDIG